jgi:hypothetical protein
MSRATEGIWQTVPRTKKTEQQRRGERAAGQQLHELLRRPGGHRHQWEKETDDVRPGQVNQAAVCQVLAQYLWELGEQPDSKTDLPRALKDPVSKALRGLGLTSRLLERFIAAFGIDQAEAAHLQLLHRGERRPSVIVGNLPPPEQMPEYRPQKYDILKLQEHHWLGADGLPARHRTEILIRSRIDRLTSYQYRFDTPHARVHAKRGGEACDLYEVGSGIWASELTFPHPLQKDEEHYMEFWTLLKYDMAPPRELRRGTHERIEQLDIRVEFNPKHLPSAVWWAEWGHYTGVQNEVIDRDQFEPNEEHAVHRHVGLIERTVVGFYWDW